MHEIEFQLLNLYTPLTPRAPSPGNSNAPSSRISPLGRYALRKNQSSPSPAPRVPPSEQEVATKERVRKKPRCDSSIDREDNVENGVGRGCTGCIVAYIGFLFLSLEERACVFVLSLVFTLRRVCLVTRGRLALDFDAIGAKHQNGVTIGLSTEMTMPLLFLFSGKLNLCRIVISSLARYYCWYSKCSG